MPEETGRGLVRVEQLVKEDGYRSVLIHDTEGQLFTGLGYIVSGKSVARFDLRGGEGIELEQHFWYQRNHRYLLVVTNQGGGPCVWGGRVLAEGEQHTPQVFRVAGYCGYAPTRGVEER